MTDEIWVVADHDGGELNEVTIEILGEARDLARRLEGKVCGILLGHETQRIIDTLASYGADKVYLVEHELLADYVTDIYTQVMVDLVRQWQPSIVIFGATCHSSDLATRLAAQLSVPIATDCIKLELNENDALIATKPSYGEQVYIKLIFAGNKPYLATMRPGVIGTEPRDTSRTAEVVQIKPAIDTGAARMKFRRRFKPDPATLALSEAEMIVAGGGGASAKEDWSLIEDFAHNLGASVGGSRVAADRGFIPRERVVGQSGVYVTPRLYIGIGISGDTHHTQGMKDAKTIIAINKDRAAPIFNIADLKVISDLRQLLPELNGVIHQARGNHEEETAS